MIMKQSCMRSTQGLRAWGSRCWATEFCLQATVSLVFVSENLLGLLKTLDPYVLNNELKICTTNTLNIIHSHKKNV